MAAPKTESAGSRRRFLQLSCCLHFNRAPARQLLNLTRAATRVGGEQGRSRGVETALGGVGGPLPFLVGGNIMPAANVSFGESLFQDQARGYMFFGGSHLRWDTEPKHLLAIPPHCDPFQGDCHVTDLDITTRAMAMHLCAKHNAAELAKCSTPDEWYVVIKFQGWLDSSLVTFLCEKGTANVVIDTKVTLVRPTKEEIEQFGGVAGKAVTHA
jgi:hypothetical protein